MTSYMRPDSRFTRRRKRGLDNDHSHRGVRTVLFNEGCVEPLRTGPDILLDGGFEKSNGQGPGGDEIPGTADVAGLHYPFLNWEDDSEAFVSDIADNLWTQEDSGSGGKVYNVSSTNAHSGTYHLRVVLSSASSNSDSLYVTTFFRCDETLGGIWGTQEAGIVKPGDIITLKLWAAFSVLPTSPTIQTLWAVQDFAGTDNQGIVTTDPPVSATAYTEYVDSWVVGDAAEYGFEPYYLQLALRAAWTGSYTGTIDFDDISLGIE